LFKKQWKKQTQGVTQITREEFLSWVIGLWEFSGESAKKVGHPAPFPLELPRRCMRLFAYTTDLVFDPFAGSGTTLLAAKKENRRCVGVEISPNYVSLAIKRLAEA